MNKSGFTYIYEFIIGDNPRFIKKVILQKNHKSEKLFINLRAFTKFEGKFLPTLNGVCFPFEYYREMIDNFRNLRPSVKSELNGELMEFRTTDKEDLFELEYNNKNGKIQKIFLTKLEIERLCQNHQTLLHYNFINK